MDAEDTILALLGFIALAAVCNGILTWFLTDPDEE